MKGRGSKLFSLYVFLTLFRSVCFCFVFCVALVNFILEEKVVSSKHLIQVHLEILGRCVENMASHGLHKKHLIWSISCHSSFTLKYYQWYLNFIYFTSLPMKLQPWGFCAGKGLFVVSYVSFDQILNWTQRILTLIDVRISFFFLLSRGTGKPRLHLYFLRMAQQRAFRQRNRRRTWACIGLFRNARSLPRHVDWLSVHSLESWNCC